MKLPMKIVWGLVAVFICVALFQIDFSAEPEKEEKTEKPKEKVVDKAFHTENLSTFVTALRTAGLDEQLNNGKVTVFAPSDSAFASLPEGKFAELMNAGNKEELKKILSYHVVADSLTTGSLKNGQVLTTMDGNVVKITLADEEAKVNGTKLVKTNIEAANGVIHVIDKVMMPAEKDSEKLTSVKD